MVATWTEVLLKATSAKDSKQVLQVMAKGNASSNERDKHVVLAAFLVAYLTATFSQFIYWRQGNEVVLIQGGLVLAYSLAALSAHSLARFVVGLNSTLAWPSALAATLAYPIVTSWMGAWSFVGIVLAATWGCVTNVFNLRQRLLKSLLLIAILGFAVGVFQFYTANARWYATIFSDLQLGAGSLFKDTLFHSAIVSMIREHGIASTGLHGLQPISYYVGVHHWVASIGDITKSDSALALSLSMHFFILPMLLYSFLHASVPILPLRHVVYFSVVTIAVFLVGQSFVFSSYNASESYGLSLVVLLSAVPLARGWLSADSIPKLRLACEISFATALVLLAGLIKAPTGVALLALFAGAVFVRAYRHCRMLAIIGFACASILSSAVLLILYLFYFDPNLMPLEFLHFSRHHPKDWYITLFIAIALLIVIAICTLVTPTPSFGIFAVAGIVFLAIFVPVQLFAFVNRGGFYFIHPGLVIMLVLTLYLMFRHLDKVAAVSTLRWFGMASSICIIAILGNGFSAFRKVERRTFDLMKELDHGAHSLRQIAAKLDHMTEESGRSAVVYVPPGNSVIWKSGGTQCWANSFLVPALTRLPMLAGVPGHKSECENTNYYGMNEYGSGAQNRELSTIAVCKEAGNLGFSDVYRLGNDTAVEKLNCALTPGGGIGVGNND